MKLCDLTQFYSPVSGGVKRYLAEKVRYLDRQPEHHEHVLIIPGAEDAVLREGRTRTYTIRSPLVSRQARYRVLLRLEEVERILERERPDLIECGDPYQVGWKALACGVSLGIPVVQFYHSHFPEAYLRGAQRYLGPRGMELLFDGVRRYVRRLYNGGACTLVPSPALGAVLTAWGVRRVVETDLGVDTAVFQPREPAPSPVRDLLRLQPAQKLLLYAGRLAPEKNTRTLCAAMGLLARASPGRYHLLVVGDGEEREPLAQLTRELGGDPAPLLGHGPLEPKAPGTFGGRRLAPGLSWIPYCDSSPQLAQLYRAADLFVHPGVQETFGLVALEAQACGTPVLGVRGSYMDRIILGGQEHWATENSAPALAKAIAQAAQAPAPLAREELARQVVARFSWEGVFARLFALYGEVIEHHRLSPFHE